MPKHNPQLLTRKTHPPVTRTFADADHPDCPVTVTFVKISPSRMIDATAAADKLLEMAPDGFPLANGELVKLTQTTARTVCLLEALQPADLPDEDRYSAGDFLGIMENQPDVFFKLQAFSAQFVPDLSDLGN